MDNAFNEVLVWGVIFIILLIGLFMISKVLVSVVGSRVRSRGTLFGMDIQDVEQLKKKGSLTPEEEKAVRAAMSRRLLERVKAEEKVKTLPAKADQALGAIDVDAARRMKEQESEPPLQPRVETLQPPPLPSFPEAEPLPPELTPYLRSSDMELEDLRQAGFLSDHDLNRLRRARGDK